ncbi:hypothetical protein CLAFUW4_00346 [Fulvia fulva]|uniref:MAGE domain-containing protein n=1 Tax=Passalora fulva TaxID=5499 RepID=A0A9Q8L808_PASFU|nr:uncharacterized protein CLAFUR5_00345 [Fulvia fulva]KAK4634736.1 hypothetical protein CLAFUR4_00346 [Fulvia fulva]KAK4637663.1 hypothetical protein CLAFUR0_00347 [Fulvia fulva]UJO12547.1 hypothetical protein CLAFUR5_00345 [Fulvia fulva]WPV10346.1 hypothetical protein CLAFUW4_00346 [Fulvia fulva]WPV24333.1 hypothetical protein CLAFUW7_00350 [Fulvia fulva]
MPRVAGRKRRSEPEEVDAEDSPAPETQRRRTNNASDDEELFGGAAAGSSTQGGAVEDMAKKLVRLALACEFQRKPLRRGDISEKVLGAHGRQFKAVFAQTQAHLREVFGMELVELPAKEKITLQQRRAAAKSQSQSKGATSWIVTSILPSEFRDPAIMSPPAAPTIAEESKYVAVYTMLVAIIMLNGGSLPDAKMERNLKKLQIGDNTPISEYDKTEKLMKRLEKDGYIVRVKENTGTGEDDIYWIVGSRGKVEVGTDAVRGLASAVFGHPEDEVGAELDKKLKRSLGLNEETGETAPQVQPAERPRRTAKKKARPAEDDEDEGEDDDDEDD